MENTALNRRSDTKLNKPSPRRQRRQMEQRKKSNEFYPAVFPISLSQKGCLARKSGSRQVVHGLLGEVNTWLFDYSGLSFRTNKKWSVD